MRPRPDGEARAVKPRAVRPRAAALPRPSQPEHRGDGTALTRTARRAGRAARRHWLLLILLAAGLGLRVVTQLAYRPAIFYIDSYKYLRGSGGYDPVGYNLLLKPILWAGNLATIAAVQHLLGLAMAVILYLTLTRRHAPRWAAALATAPLLLDAYQLQMEQTIMPDVTFEALILGGLAILLWNPRPRIWRLAAGALVLGLAADVRQIGEVLIIPAVIFAVLVARGCRRRLGYLGAAAAFFAVPVLGYMTVSMITGNGFALASRGAGVLYGRAAVAADCTTLRLSASERSLCPALSVAVGGIDRIVDNADGPYQSYKPSPGTTKEQAADDFGLAVLRQQPLAIPLSVLRDAARLFALTRDGAANITQISRWQFQPAYPTFPPGVTLSFVASEARTYGGGAPVAVRPLASFLRAYQLDGGYTPGPLPTAMTGAGAIGSLFVFARRVTGRRGSEAGRPRGSPADRQLAAAAMLTTLAAVTVVLGSDIYEFSWRYQLPALVTLPLAGVFGAMVIARRFRLRPDRRPGPPAGLEREMAAAGRPGPAERQLLCAVRRLIGLPGAADAGPRACARRAVGGQLDHHLVPGHVVADDRTGSLRGLHGLAEPGCILAEVLVERVLVLQAAHQPAARPGDPHRVDGQVLFLGHPDGYRLEVFQEGGAAQVAPAGPDAALQAGLVARAHLAQLHPGAHLAGEVADQGTEVDPVGGAEIDGEGVRGVHVVDRGHLHRQPVGPDEALGGDPALGPPAAAGLVAREVVLGRDARALGQAAHVVGYPLRRPDTLGDLGTGVGGHEHLVADGRRVRPWIEVVQPSVPLEADRHHHAHHVRLRRKGRLDALPPDEGGGEDFAAIVRGTRGVADDALDEVRGDLGERHGHSGERRGEKA